MLTTSIGLLITPTSIHSPQHWVNDCCEAGYIPDMNHERAMGISKIHASCTPPCPRVIAALEFLRGGERRESDGGCELWRLRPTRNTTTPG